MYFLKDVYLILINLLSKYLIINILKEVTVKMFFDRNYVEIENNKLFIINIKIYFN